MIARRWCSASYYLLLSAENEHRAFLVVVGSLGRCLSEDMARTGLLSIFTRNSLENVGFQGCCV
jgi:hypothetical protein